MKVAALSSGSCGNCFYISDGKNGLLVDVGISCKKIIENLCALGENPWDVRGVFVTHEHTDHTRGVDVFARKFNVPIYATQGTIKNSFLSSNENLVVPIKKEDLVMINGFEISSFGKSHDASQPVSFSIRDKMEGKKVCVITDIGHACKNVIENVGEADFLIMESNHDLKMLNDGPYPYFLKRRIASDEGHLSNLDSGLCVLEHGHKKLKRVMLAHLSKTNNTPLAALTTFNSLINERKDLNPQVNISLRSICSPLFKV